MTRIFALPVTVIATAMATLAADQLPQNESQEPDSFDIEQRALKVARIESDFANAQLARAKNDLAAQESQLATGEGTKDELEAAKAAVAQLTEAAQIAAAKRERAELDAAEANLRRQEKLLHLGSAHKSDVNRAQEKLAELKAPKN